jgi:4-amino-4-deoxy-L-arabinose transferase-like glycosyltransferase
LVKRPPRARSFDGLFVAVFALAASAAGLLNDFVYDDIPLVRDNARVHDLAHLTAIFGKPYWPPPFVEQLYRPLSLLLLAMQYAVGGGSPMVFRLVSYALYAACAVAVFRLASEMLPRRAALAAAALFAVHPVHVEAVALGVNQGELLVGLIAALVTARYVARRRTDAWRARDWAVAGVLYAVAALTKESGIILPVLLLVAELFLIDRPLRERVSHLWRGYGLLAAIGAAALVARAAVLGDHFASVPAASIAGLGLGDRMVTMLQIVPHWLRLLVWPARLQADHAPAEFVAPAALGAPEAAGLFIVVATIAAIVWARRRAPVVSFGLAWCAMALLPVSNIVPTGIMLAERTLFVPSIGFLIAVAGLGEHLMLPARSRARLVERTLLAVCVVLLVLGVMRSIGRQRVWNTTHLEIVGRAPAR